MSRVLVALIVGAAIGGAVFLFLRAEPAPVSDAAPVTASGVPEAGSGRVISRAFVSVTHPGLVVTVTRAGVAEAQTRVELSRSIRSIRSLTTSERIWPPAGMELTDAEGRAEFPAVAGHYYVTATAPDGSRAVEPVDVSRAAGSTFLSIALKPMAPFSGQVVDAATRRPVPGALIRADPQPEPKELEPTLAVGSAVADSLGRFGLELPAQRWRFEARAQGYLSNAIDGEPPGKALVIELTRGVKLSGLVVDPAGQPIGDASLRITPGDVSAMSTDAAGRFTLIVPHAPISLHALAPDGRQGLSRIALSAQQETAQVRIVVGEGAELVGLVRDAQGPVAQADVRILAEPESLEVAAFETASDGRFAAKGLPPGRYSVRAQHGLGRRAGLVGLELPGAAPVELVLSAAGRVVGVVNDEAGRPAEGAEVLLRWPLGLHEVRRTARTGSDGRFEFEDLLPAEVFVQAQLDDLVSEESGTYVAPGATVELVLVTGPQGRLVGTIVGQAVDRVMVRNDRPGGEFIEVDKAERRFEKLLPPGSYRVFAEVKGEKHNEFQFIESISAEVRAGELTTVVLQVPGEGRDAGTRNFKMHPELGSGISFENSPGGVRVDFLMAECPAALAGVQIGDLVVTIDGESARDALDAFARMRKPSDGTTLQLAVRRGGQDLVMTLR